MSKKRGDEEEGPGRAAQEYRGVKVMKSEQNLEESPKGTRAVWGAEETGLNGGGAGGCA